MSGSNSSLVRPIAWLLLAALIGVYLLYDWYSGHLSEQLAGKSARIAEAAEQLEAREARIGEKQREITQLEERIAELAKRHSGEKLQLSDQHSQKTQELTGRIATLEQGNSQLEEAIEALRRTDATTLAEEQARTAAVGEERDLGIVAFKALQSQYEIAVAKADDLQAELTGLRQVIADSTREHREQIEALERHLNERVQLAKATPKDTELMRAAQAAGLLPEALGMDEDAAALADQLAETQAALQALQTESQAARDAHGEQLAALEEELKAARAALAEQSQQSESPDVVAALQERLAQTEAELTKVRDEAAAALEKTEATTADQLDEARAQIAALSDQLTQAHTPEAVAALQERLEAAEDAFARLKSDTEAALTQAEAELKRRIQESEAEIAGLTEQISSEQSAKAKITADKEAVLAELEDARGQLMQVRQAADNAGDEALAAARMQIAALEEAISKERGKAEQVRSSMQQDADRVVAEARDLYRRFSELGGTYTERGVLLKLADTELLFQPAMATLTGGDFPSLDRIAALFDAYPDLDVRIEGHTDSLGDEAINLALSQQRAEAVKQALIERGVEAHRLTARGLGPERPIADNDTPAGRAQNRRVEVYVSEG